MGLTTPDRPDLEVIRQLGGSRSCVEIESDDESNAGIFKRGPSRLECGRENRHPLFSTE